MTHDPRAPRRRGRGALANQGGRFESTLAELDDDGWGSLEEPPREVKTKLHIDNAKTVVSRNSSPDVPFSQSVNVYRGCEHGCIYCYARPTHAYLGLSPGLDFETEIFYKPDAAACLTRELGKRGYVVEPIGLGANTDPYQPVEKRLGLTRAVLEVLQAHDHPVGIVTKSSLVERDITLLADMASRNVARVSISIPTLNAELARVMEPRTTAPRRRLRTVQALSDAGIPVNVLIAPVIPGLNDTELEEVIGEAKAHGALDVRYSVIRLPLEIAELFEQWLREHYPLKAERVLTLIRDLRDGKLYRSDFAQRMHGTGPIATLLADRFKLARRRANFPGWLALDTHRFRPPKLRGPQMELFA
jgi:DNA repair photolyase